MPSSRVAALYVLAAGAVILAPFACADVAVVCTQEFRYETVFVVDAQVSPVTDATVTTTLVRTGRVVPPTSVVDLIPGAYLILDDGALPLFQSDQETFRVTLQRSTGGPVEVEYRFEAAGGCHISKIAGPDTVQVP